MRAMDGADFPSLNSVQASSQRRQATQRDGSASSTPSAFSVMMSGAAIPRAAATSSQAESPATAAPVSLRNRRRERSTPSAVQRTAAARSVSARLGSSMVLPPFGTVPPDWDD